jgi:hypothetical protein
VDVPSAPTQVYVEIDIFMRVEQPHAMRAFKPSEDKKKS